MTRLALSSLLFTILVCSCAAQDSVRWVHLSDPQMEIDGLPWYGENGGELFRLPARLKDTYRKPVWDLAQSPSGARIRFRTNSSTLAIRLEYPHPAQHDQHACFRTNRC
jgi:hypothetical protein